jgi:hypothetical protein
MVKIIEDDFDTETDPPEWEDRCYLPATTISACEQGQLGERVDLQALVPEIVLLTPWMTITTTNS